MNLCLLFYFPTFIEWERAYMHTKIHTSLEEAEGHLYRHGKGHILLLFLFLSFFKPSHYKNNNNNSNKGSQQLDLYWEVLYHNSWFPVCNWHTTLIAQALVLVTRDTAVKCNLVFWHLAIMWCGAVFIYHNGYSVGFFNLETSFFSSRNFLILFIS